MQSHVQDKLVTAIKAALNEFYPSQQPLIKSDQYCKVINQGMYSRLKGLLEETKGQVVIGGETDDAAGKMSFTLIKGVKEDDSTMSSEIFGPLLPIVTASSKEEMVKFIQARDQPLALYVFTQSNKNRDFSASPSPSSLRRPTS